MAQCVRVTTIMLNICKKDTPMNLRIRLWPPTVAACATALIAGCSTGPFGTQVAEGRYFQYLSPDNQVVAEYATPDTATCQRHMANL